MDTALSPFLLLTFPIAFLLHDAEEVVTQHRWMAAHGETLCRLFPRVRKKLRHLMRLETKAFAIAVAEEFAVITAVIGGILCGLPGTVYALTALQLAFYAHLLMHIGQSITLRGYVPGAATSVLLFPLGAASVHRIWNQMEAETFALCLVGGVAFTACNLRIAHGMGTLCTKKKKKE